MKIRASQQQTTDNMTRRMCQITDRERAVRVLYATVSCDANKIGFFVEQITLQIT